MSTYGVVNGRTGEYFDVSRTERGAKNYATRHGYSIVARRGDGSYNVFETAFRDGKRWREWEPSAREIIDSNARRAKENLAKIYGG